MAWPTKLSLLALSVNVTTWIASACTSDEECSLLGNCTSTGVCECDPGWTSATCSVLDLAPAPTRERQARMTNSSSWGGNAIRDASTGFYHLFFSEMRTGGLHSYSEPGHCQLTTAVSQSSPLGPYIHNRTVLRSSAIDGPTNGSISHNVQPVLGPDGAIYIFMITSNPHPTFPGVGSHGREERDMRASSHAENSTVSMPKSKPNLSVMVGRASRLGARFEWVTPLLLQADGQAVLKDNPTAIVFGNGTVLMATRGTALFRADSWRGPYHMLSASIIPNETLPNRDPRSTKTEDPFLWQSPRGFHLLMHDHAPFPFHKQVLTYAFTADRSAQRGWKFLHVEAANGTDIHFDDGSVHTFCSRQRPQLLFSEPAGADGVQRGRPVVLFTGAQHGHNTDNTSLCGAAAGIVNASEYNPYDDYSFTFAQPVRS